MHHTLVDLLTRNAFATMGLAPSTPTAEFRRTADQARLKVDADREPESNDAVASAHEAVSSEPGCFEMRVFAPWAGDAHFGPWTEAHDAMLAALSALPGPGPETVNQALDHWLLFGQGEGVIEALAEFAPENLDPAAFWGEVATEIVQAGTVRVGRPAGAGLLRRVIEDGWTDASPTVAILEKSLGVEVESLLVAALTSRDEGERSVEALASLDATYGRVRRQIAELVAVVETAVSTGAPWAAGTVRFLLGEAMLVEEAVTDAFSAGGDFVRAEKVVLDTLELPFGPTERERLNAHLAVVRSRKEELRGLDAFLRGDFAEAATSYDRVVATTADAAERAGAANARAKMQELARIAEDPYHTPWWRNRSLLIAAGIVVALLVGAGVWISSAEDDRRKLDEFGARMDHNATVARQVVDSFLASETATAAALRGTAAASGSPAGAPTPFSYVSGECIAVPPGANAPARSPCVAGAWKVTNVTELPGTTFPSDQEAMRFAATVCPGPEATYTRATAQGWAAGFRLFVCLRPVR